MRFITKENVYVMSLFACFLVINVILAFPIRSIGLFTLNVLGAIAILNAFLCRYVLIVNNDTISYHTKLLGWSLYKRSFSAEQIAGCIFAAFMFLKNASTSSRMKDGSSHFDYLKETDGCRSWSSLQ